MPEDLIAGHLTPWRIWNRGGARPVLALHCSLAHSGAWTGLASLLSSVTVTALDQPSHGRSADWDQREDLHTLTTRISVAMAETIAEDNRVDLIGHSFGATVALRMALERPDLVRSLTLIEPVVFGAAKGSDVYDRFRAGHLAFAELVLTGKRAEAAAVFHGVWGNGEAFADLPDKTSRYMLDRIHLIEAQNPVLLDDSAGMLRPGALEGVVAPVLLIDGADSPPIIDAVHRSLAGRLPNVQRLTVPGAGHMVPITHPDWIAAEIQAHLDQS